MYNSIDRYVLLQFIFYKMLRTVLLIYIWCENVNGISTWNRSSAEEQCNGRGGLISYKDVMKYIKNGRDIASLNDGDSSWISGFAKFSEFVSWYGCFSLNNKREIKHKRKLTDNNIYRCLTYCTGYRTIINFKYIGLQQEMCYCLRSKEYLHNIRNALVHGECRPQLIEPNYNYDSDDRNSPLQTYVYKIINQSRFFWYQNTPNYFGQCVYVMKTDDGQRYATKSCLTDADGLICTNSSFSKMDECEYNNESVTYCVVSSSSNWLNAVGQCKDYSGKLAIYSYVARGDLDVSKIFWTGAFRSYDIVSEYIPTSPSPCLTVTKVDNKYFINPANCSAENSFICADNVLSTRVTKSDTTASKSTYHAVTEKSSPAEESNGENDLTLIYVAVGVVITILLFVLVVWIVVRKKLTSQRQQTLKENNSNVEEDDYATIDENETKSPNACAMPKSLHQNNETTEQLSGLQSNQNECEYDRVNLKVPGNSDKQCTVNLTEQTADMHVYGHHPGGVDDVTGDYDHLGALNAQQKAKPQDGVYSTMADETDTYNVLKAKDIAYLDKSRDNKQQKEESNNLYGKLSHEH